MTTMEHYAVLAEKYGLSVSGVRYRLRTGKPLDATKGKHKRERRRSGPRVRHVLCLSCIESFPPIGKFNRICPSCRDREIHKAELATT